MPGKQNIGTTGKQRKRIKYLFSFSLARTCLSVTEIIDENRFYFFDFQLIDENMINLKCHCFVSPNETESISIMINKI